MWCGGFFIRQVGGEAGRWVVDAALGAVGTAGAVDAGAAGRLVYVCACKHHHPHRHLLNTCPVIEVHSVAS